MYVRVIIGPGNGLLPVYRQAITWTKVSLLLIWPLVAKVCNLNQNGSWSFPRNAFQKSAAKYTPYIQALICERALIAMYIGATFFVIFHCKLLHPSIIELQTL